jgi:hypothetical protein
MAFLRIFLQLCENNGISIGLQYTPSVLNIWADKLSRRQDASDWALTPTVIKNIQKQLTATVNTQVYARRETVIPGVRHYHSPTGTGQQDPAGLPLPSIDDRTSWPPHMGLTLVTPTPAQAGLVLRNLIQAPSHAAVVVPDCPAQPRYNPALRVATTNLSLPSPTWRRARHTEKILYYEDYSWVGRLLIFHKLPPDPSTGKPITPDSPASAAPPMGEATHSS